MSVGPAKEKQHRLTVDENGKRGYERKFYCQCSAGTTRAQALLADDMPRWGDTHSEDVACRVTNLSAELADEGCPTIYEMTATYSSSAPDDSKAINPENPLEDPPKFAFKTIRDKRIAEKDKNNKAYLNSSKVMFDPPFERQWNRRSITIDRNEPVYSDAYANDWQNVVNSEDWGAYPAGTAMVVAIDAESKFERGLLFWAVHYEIEINPDGWQPSLLDRGLHILDGDGKPKPIERDGVRISEPVLLDGSGVEATGTPPTPAYIDFEEYDERAFSSISLPAPV